MDSASSTPAYDHDLHGWAEAQARLIRAGKFELVDWDHVAEEIEGLGGSEYDALESALRVLLTHLLKWEHQPSFRSRSWYNTIREQHRQYRRRLDRSPGLKSRLEEIRAEAYRQAKVAAEAETGISEQAFPAEPPGWNVIENPPVSLDDIIRH
jgi:hypothetical protein